MQVRHHLRNFSYYSFYNIIREKFLRPFLALASEQVRAAEPIVRSFMVIRVASQTKS